LHSSTLAKRAWLFLFIAIAAFYLWGLNSFPLVGPDEPRYAEVAREMLARHDLITPTLGGLPWFEKPALLYWMMMLSSRVLGVGEYAARLGPAFCGLLTAMFVYWLGSATQAADAGNLKNETASWSALVWLSSLGAIGFSRGATFDIVLTMTVTGALTFFFVSHIKTGRQSKPAARYWLWLGFYLFAGLSLLAKGLIGFVIIFGVIGLYFALRREWPGKRLLVSLAWGIPFSLAVASLWYGPMISRHGWTFVNQFIIQHHFARFATNKYHHPGPFYFYLPVLIGLALPWPVVLGASLINARKWRWRADSPLDRMRVFALAWLVLPIVFFSFSGSKLAGYILPVLPAVALLAGEHIDSFVRQRRGGNVLRITGVLLILIAAAGGWYTHRTNGLGWLIIGLAAAPPVLFGALAVLRPRARMFVLIALAALLTTAISLKLAGPGVAESQSARDLLASAAARGYGNTPVVQINTIERSAEFYAAGRIAYGSDGEPIKFEGLPEVLDAARRNGGTVLCFVPAELEPQLVAARQASFEVIGDNGKVALVLVHAR
jgi:4-amino-4-deoxy-L-arabinose transferase-like glycosyltransferase